MNTAYLNDQYLPLDEARVSVMDRGFLFGDGVYEVIPVYGGRLFRLDQHLERLENSLYGIMLPNPLSQDQWRAVLERLVAMNNGGEQAVYLQVTRGTAARRDHLFPDEVEPTVFAMSSPMIAADPRLLEQGVSLVTVPDIRWRYCHLKTIALLGNVLMRQAAEEEEADEAVLIRDGQATECSASNLFLVNAGVIVTPPKSDHLLPGITRDLLLELARQNHMPFEEREIPESELSLAEEIWITSSSKEVLPATRLNNQAVGDGRPGPLWRRMLSYYQDYKERLINGLAE